MDQQPLSSVSHRRRPTNDAMKNMERAKSFVASRSTPSDSSRYKAEKTTTGIMTTESGKADNKFKRCNSLTAAAPFGVGQQAQTADLDPKGQGSLRISQSTKYSYIFL